MDLQDGRRKRAGLEMQPGNAQHDLPVLPITGKGFPGRMTPEGQPHVPQLAGPCMQDDLPAVQVPGGIRLRQTQYAPPDNEFALQIRQITVIFRLLGKNRVIANGSARLRDPCLIEFQRGDPSRHLALIEDRNADSRYSSPQWAHQFPTCQILRLSLSIAVPASSLGGPS